MHTIYKKSKTAISDKYSQPFKNVATWNYVFSYYKVTFIFFFFFLIYFCGNKSSIHITVAVIIYIFNQLFIINPPWL